MYFSNVFSSEQNYLCNTLKPVYSSKCVSSPKHVQFDSFKTRLTSSFAWPTLPCQIMSQLLVLI